MDLDTPAISAGRVPAARLATGPLEGVTRSIAWTGGVLVLVSLPVPYALGDSGLSAVLAGALVAVVAGAIVLSEPRQARGTALALFACAYLVRLGALLALYAIVPTPVSVLGPDSLTYLRMSQFMAESQLSLPQHPVAILGSWDVAQYYLFAATLYVLDGDLFTLKLVNCGLTALAAPLVHGLFRLLLPRFALLSGAIVAFHPSVIVLSIADLLKDPAVLFAMVLAAWALARLLAVTRPAALVGFFAVAAGALTFLRMARFYVVPYLEVAVIGAGFIAWLRGRRIRVPMLVGVTAAFVVAEIVPMQLGWPASPVLVASIIGPMQIRVGMLGGYAPGLLDRTRGGGPGHSRRRIDSQDPWLVRAAWRVAVQAANLVRRLYGPFVWVAPERWDVRTILAGDYLLYPGTVLWYGLLPFMGLGFAVTGLALCRGDERDPALSVIWLFVAIYFAQYLAINLSYRQRDVMLPFILVFAFIGIRRAARSPRWRRAYAGYWGLVGFMAVAHLLVRAYSEAAGK